MFHIRLQLVVDDISFDFLKHKEAVDKVVFNSILSNFTIKNITFNEAHDIVEFDMNENGFPHYLQGSLVMENDWNKFIEEFDLFVEDNTVEDQKVRIKLISASKEKDQMYHITLQLELMWENDNKSFDVDFEENKDVIDEVLFGILSDFTLRNIKFNSTHDIVEFDMTKSDFPDYGVIHSSMEDQWNDFIEGGPDTWMEGDITLEIYDDEGNAPELTIALISVQKIT
jgi:hypothetical protein